MAKRSPISATAELLLLRTFSSSVYRQNFPQTKRPYLGISFARFLNKIFRTYVQFHSGFIILIWWVLLRVSQLWVLPWGHISSKTFSAPNGETKSDQKRGGAKNGAVHGDWRVRYGSSTSAGRISRMFFVCRYFFLLIGCSQPNGTSWEFPFVRIFSTFYCITQLLYCIVLIYD